MSKVEIDDLKRTSAEITDAIVNKPPTLENMEDIVDMQLLKKAPRRVNFQRAPTTHPEPTPVVNDNFFAIGSYNIPKPTLFLTIALLVIGVVIWFTTGKSNKKQPQQQQLQLQLQPPQQRRMLPPPDEDPDE